MIVNELPFALTDNPNTEIVTDNFGHVLKVKMKLDSMDSALDWTKMWEFSIDYINLNSQYIEGWVAVNPQQKVPMMLLWG